MNLLKSSNLPIIIFLFIIWRIFLFVPQEVSKSILELKAGYVNDFPWANFDGVHYLSIAENGYSIYQQAFFPLFPLLIKLTHDLLKITYINSAFLIVNISLFFAIFAFYKLLRIDKSLKDTIWTIIFLLAFPTSFFLGSIYTESLFLFFIFTSFYFARKRNFILSSIFGMLATATRFVGIFILPAILLELYICCKKGEKKISAISTLFILIATPFGLLLYSLFLQIFYKDPLLFFHTQASFGANRAVGEIILLPQVLFRYIKIFLNVPFTSYSLWIALLEFTFFLIFITVLIVNIKKIRISYLAFSFLAILIPTVTGTLSSEPRYALSAFPFFIILSKIKSTKIKIFILIIFCLLFILLTSLFLRGYFVA